MSNNSNDEKQEYFKYIKPKLEQSKLPPNSQSQELQSTSRGERPNSFHRALSGSNTEKPIHLKDYSNIPGKLTQPKEYQPEKMPDYESATKAFMAQYKPAEASPSTTEPQPNPSQDKLDNLHKKPSQTPTERPNNQPRESSKNMESPNSKPKQEAQKPKSAETPPNKVSPAENPSMDDKITQTKEQGLGEGGASPSGNSSSSNDTDDSQETKPPSPSPLKGNYGQPPKDSNIKSSRERLEALKKQTPQNNDSQENQPPKNQDTNEGVRNRYGSESQPQPPSDSKDSQEKTQF